MKSRAQWFLVLMVLSCLAGCGGGGGGTSGNAPQTPQTPQTPTGSSATLRVAVAGVSLPMSGIKATITLPAGVAVATNPDASVPAGTVLPSGVLAPASAALVPGSVSYDPVGHVLSFILYSTTQGGFTVGEFASVSCQISGTAPAAGDFHALLEPVDLSGAFFPAASVAASFLLAP